jgi:hypothetical protein
VTPHDLIRALLDTPLEAERVVAKTPHGTYMFDIVAVEQDDDAPVILRLAEAS